MGVRRVTITDVARAAGVSIGAVSNAINGRKGVSEPTRARVLAAADRLGWTPSVTARSLMGARTRTVGLVLTRDSDGVPATSYYARFVSGVESALSDRDHALLLEVAPPSTGDVEAHRRWFAARQVDGLIVMDLRPHDRRVEALTAPEAPPALAVGDPSGAGDLPTVWVDEAGAMRRTVGHLAGLGHRRIVRLAGPEDRVATIVKDAAFSAACLEHGVDGSLVRSTGSSAALMAATRSVLLTDPRPTAVLYPDDVSAVGGMSVAADLGLRVPRDLSIVAWYDSDLTPTTFPPLTAVGWDVRAVGEIAAALLLDVLAGETATSVLAATPELAVRESTGPAPA